MKDWRCHNGEIRLARNIGLEEGPMMRRGDVVEGGEPALMLGCVRC